jgi:hypothetical protein
LQFVTIEDPAVKAIGACNTVLFNVQTIVSEHRLHRVHRSL